MPKKAKAARTPSQIMLDMIICSMDIRKESATSLAAKMNVHRNTVMRDFQCPEGIPQDRLWMYFTVLDIPIDSVLRPIAQQMCEEMIRR